MIFQNGDFAYERAQQLCAWITPKLDHQFWIHFGRLPGSCLFRLYKKHRFSVTKMHRPAKDASYEGT